MLLKVLFNRGDAYVIQTETCEIHLLLCLVMLLSDWV